MQREPTTHRTDRVAKTRFDDVKLHLPPRSRGYPVPRDEVIEYARK